MFMNTARIVLLVISCLVFGGHQYRKRMAACNEAVSHWIALPVGCASGQHASKSIISIDRPGAQSWRLAALAFDPVE